MVDAPLAVVGDLHGRADLLELMLAKLAETHPAAQIVFVGDYMDRGPDSAEVLKRVMGLPDAICLMGNHERMLLSFLEDPEGQGARWIKHGGRETMLSFGITPDATTEQRDALKDRIGADGLAWLTSRPLLFQSGNLYVTHAGADPAAPIEGQGEESLLWGHPDFGRKWRKDGAWVVHGHTIVPEPVISKGTISIDTGAFATDRLTAAVFDAGEVEFFEVSA